jgi:hypothetical protein
MNAKTPKPTPYRKERNHRYLVSLWEKDPDAKQAPKESMQGVVWEADPRDPGRIITPQKFVGLSALPEVLSELLDKKANKNDVEGS